MLLVIIVCYYIVCYYCIAVSQQSEVDCSSMAFHQYDSGIGCCLVSLSSVVYMDELLHCSAIQIHKLCFQLPQNSALHRMTSYLNIAWSAVVYPAQIQTDQWFHMQYQRPKRIYNFKCLSISEVVICCQTVFDDIS